MREASELPQPSIFDIDPEDPTQLLDDAGQLDSMELEAQPHAEADAELDAAVATAEGYGDTSDNSEARDSGDLYGVQLHDVETHEAFKDAELGEHVFETLEKKMAEGGAQPETELDIEDDSDAERSHSRTDRREPAAGAVSKATANVRRP